MKYLYTITQMKHLLFLFILMLVLSCNSSSKESQSLIDLKSKKEVLIKEMNRIGTELKDIETAISKLDTLKKLMTRISLLKDAVINGIVFYKIDFTRCKLTEFYQCFNIGFSIVNTFPYDVFISDDAIGSSIPML